eukprot:175479-Chlamydomonas_euryale.AAC.1
MALKGGGCSTATEKVGEGCSMTWEECVACVVIKHGGLLLWTSVDIGCRDALCLQQSAHICQSWRREGRRAGRVLGSMVAEEAEEEGKENREEGRHGVCVGWHGGGEGGRGGKQENRE